MEFQNLMHLTANGSVGIGTRKALNEMSLSLSKSIASPTPTTTDAAIVAALNAQPTPSKGQSEPLGKLGLESLNQVTTNAPVSTSTKVAGTSTPVATIIQKKKATGARIFQM